MSKEVLQIRGDSTVMCYRAASSRSVVTLYLFIHGPAPIWTIILSKLGQVPQWHTKCATLPSEISCNS